MNLLTKAFAVAASLAIALTLSTASPDAPVAEGAPPIVELQIAGVNGVPQDATGAILNIAAARATSRGYVTAWPCGQPQPATSILNFVPGHAVSNSTIVAVGQDGKVCVSRSADADLIIDVNGAFTSSSDYRAMNPQRVLDMRSSGPTRAGSQVTLPIAGVGAVPSDATSVVLNITSARSAERGYVTAWPCDTNRPTTSSLNFQAGVNVANSATIDLSSSGSVCLWSNAETNLVVDVNGVFVGDGIPFVPYRLLDTRNGTTVQGGETVEVQISGQPGVAPSATAAVLNIGSANSAGRGHVTAWPCDSPKPLATSLNFLSTPTSNTTVLGIGASGRVCFSPSTTTNLVIDINGTFSSSDGVITFSPTRILDTRGPVVEGPGDFVETFDGNTGLERFDYGLWHRDDDVLRTRQWTGDHDENCGSPATQRTIRREAWQDSFYMCRDHMMTSVGDTSGYSVGWFAPNQTFSDKRTVSWDVNMTNLGARQWWEVMIVPAGDDSYFRPKRVADGTDCLVCATRDGMAQTAGLPTYGPGSIAVGSGPWGVNIHLGGEEQYSGWQGTCGADWGLLIDHPDDPCNSKPPRLTSSITDNGNGTITVDYAGVWTETFSGSFPDEFEVVFKDHNYTPDKDGIPAGHTWHWDNIIIN